jgi:hemerythrin-like domain-containing protein
MLGRGAAGPLIPRKPLRSRAGTMLCKPSGDSMTAVAPRAPRPARSPAPALPDFAALDSTHAAALKMLEAFEQLLAQLDEHGPGEAAVHSARAILDFFGGPGHDHHAQEERQVFPGLLAAGDAELARLVKRLQQDHGWIEEDWRELSPQIEAIAGGYNWYDLPMLRAALPIFTSLYQDHIALEESLIYPAAKQHRQALQDGEKARTEAG